MTEPAEPAEPTPDAAPAPPAAAAPESAGTRLRRLRLRSWRRGTKEMDLILGRFADAGLSELGPADLDAYERLMEENDWDLYYWITGARPAPGAHAAMVARIAAFHALR